MDLNPLAVWIRNNPQSISNKHPWVQNLIVSLVNENDGPTFFSSLEYSLKTFVERSDDHYNELNEIIDFFNAHQIDFIQIITWYIFHAPEGKNNPLLKIDKFADATGHYSLKFIAGWQAFDSGNFQKTIRICDSIPRSNVDFAILKSDALARSDQIEDAREALELALMDNPNHLELLQKLARIELVDEEWESCLRLTEVMLNIRPQHLEAIWILFEVGIRSQDRHLRSLVLAMASKKMNSISKNTELTNQALQFALELESQEFMTAILISVSWESLVHDPQFMKRLGSLLKTLQLKNWKESILLLTEKLIPVTKGSV